MKIKEQNKRSTTFDFVDLDVAKSAVPSSLRSPGSRRCYEHAIAEFIGWYCREPAWDSTRPWSPGRVN
jgi:hypothetical protein